MKPPPVSSPEDPKAPIKVGARVAVLVGGFLLLIMIIGWIYVALNHH